MNLITQITANPSQSQTLTLPNGQSFSFTMQFVPLQLGWYLYNVTYGSFQVNMIRITVLPNMLCQFVNQIPFGLGCFTQALREPTQQQDFSSGAFQLYLLSQVETQQYQQILQGVPIWNQYVTYAINYLVLYNGVIYESLVDGNVGNLPTNTAYWSVA